MRRNLALVALALVGVLRLPLGAAESAAAQRADAWLGEIRLPPKNYVANGSFEDGLKGWQYFVHQAGGIDADRPFAGAASFRMDGADENRHVYLYQYSIPLTTGTTYTLSAAVRTENLGEANRNFGVLFLTNHGWTEAAALKPPQATMDWTRISITFKAFPTRPRPDGKPSYDLVIYWPPKSQGKVWFDNVQIEEGDQATDFSAVPTGVGLAAAETLRRLATQLFATQEALAAFPPSPLLTGLTQEVEGLLAQAAGVRSDLQAFAGLAPAVRDGLPGRLDAALTAAAGSRALVWTGPAHLPLRDVPLPESRPTALALDLTCLQGEHRDLAINVANFAPNGFSARLETSDLYSDALALAVPALEWAPAYSVPRIRGYAKPAELFTDPLPELDNAGSFYVEPAAISQVLVSIDTAGLLPGTYTGSLSVFSLADRAFRQTLAVTLKVLPFRLPELTGVEITDCYGYIDYSRNAMRALGLNTLTLSTSWMDLDVDAEGKLARLDFTRLASEVQGLLAVEPGARFLFLNMQGMFRLLESRYGWTSAEPRFERAIKAWIQGMAAEMGKLGVEPARLFIETFDEPGDGDVALALQMARWAKEAVPALQTHFYASGVSRDPAWEAMAKAHDVVAPAVGLCSPETMAYLRGLGRKLWVYDCQANGESFQPLAYYRLLPWTCWTYDIRGWGHFHWFNTSHGRPYRAWDGVEAQNLVYPGRGWDLRRAGDPQEAVISRRFLAIRAGHEDYRLLRALERALQTGSAATPDALAKAKAFLAEVGQRALALAPREPGYQTHLASGQPPDLLDRCREEAVARLQPLLPAVPELSCSLTAGAAAAATPLALTAPAAGAVQVRFLDHDGRAWRRVDQAVDAGAAQIALPASDIHRCLVELRGADDRLWIGSPLPIPRVRVDSCATCYTQRPLNDGLRVAAVKFEPLYAWISGGEAVEHWVELDLGAPRQVQEVALWWMTFTGLPRQIKLTYLAGDGAWQAVSATPDWRPAASPVETLPFTPVTTSKLRLLQAPGGGGPGGPNLMGLSEIEVR